MITLSKRPTCGHVIRRQALVVPLRDEGVIGQKREHVGPDVAYKEMGGGERELRMHSMATPVILLLLLLIRLLHST